MINITYWGKKVDVNDLLGLHDITMEQLEEIILSAEDGVFTIGMNKYILPEKKKKIPNYKGTYTVKKDGKVISSGIYSKEVCFILKVTPATLTGHFKRKGDNVTVKDYFVEKDDKTGIEGDNK